MQLKVFIIMRFRFNGYPFGSCTELLIQTKKLNRNNIIDLLILQHIELDKKIRDASDTEVKDELMKHRVFGYASDGLEDFVKHLPSFDSWVKPEMRNYLAQAVQFDSNTAIFGSTVDSLTLRFIERELVDAKSTQRVVDLADVSATKNMTGVAQLFS